MDFQLQTLVLCRSFLMSSIGKHQKHLFDVDNGTDDLLNRIPKGQEILKCLLNLVQDFDQRMNQTFELDSVAEHLGLNTDKPIDMVSLEKSYLEVLDGLFEKQNWGRIIAMFAFLRMLVRRLLDGRHNYAIQSLVKLTSVYCDEKLKSWVNLHGGWYGLIEFDSPHCLNDSQELVWKTLKNVGGFATGAVGAIGLAALVGYIANKI